MGAKQSKRSVDISGKEADGAGEVAVAGAGGEGRMEALADADALKPQLNGDAHIHEEKTDKEKQLEIGTPENEKDATTEKENKEQDNEKEKEATPVTNGDPEPKENGETTPAPEDGKKPKNEKVKKKWSLRSISFSRKDKPKQDKKHKEEQPKTNGEPEKVPEEAADVATPETVKETVEEAKMEIESKDEKTPETPVTEPLTNGTSTPETPKVESPAAEEPLPTPAKEEAKPEVKVEAEPEQLPVNGLSLEEPKSEIPEISHTEESKPAETIQSTETAPVPESPFNKEVCVVALSVDTPPPPLPANPPPSAVASFAVTTMALDVDASLFNTAESPSTIALATGDQIVEPQTCALAYSTENNRPISPLKVLSYEEDENKSTAKDLDESALISSSQIDTKPVESNLYVDEIQESVKTSKIVVDNTETVIESESDAKVVLEESAIVEPHLVTEVVLEKETVTNKSENEFQQEKLNNTDVSQNNTNIDIVAEATETTNLKTSIENSRDVINETVAEPIADILKQSDNRSQSDIISEVLSEEIVSEVDNTASFVAVNKEVVEQTTDEMLDKSEEDNKNSCRSIAESIIDRVAEEVANITVDDVSVKCVTLDNIPLPGHHTDGNEQKASEVQSDVDTISEDLIPPLPEPCEIPLPESSLIESLEEAVDDLPPPPPPIEDEMLQAAVENDMKSASSCKNDIIKEASDIKVHINGLEENVTNGNGTIGEENNVKSKDSFGSTKCNGDGKLDTSVEPGHLLQDPLPVSDKIADLIPEVPVVPDLNTDTEISTNVE